MTPLQQPQGTALSALLKQACTRFPPGSDSPRLDAEILLAHVLECDRAWLIAHARETLTIAQQKQFQALLERRIAGEPIAYLCGHREFWSLDLHLNPEVLIPRPETELLVETVLEHIPATASGVLEIADLGTGSGAIALALASELPAARITATDISRGALRIAQANARRLRLDTIRFLASDWCAALGPECFHIICSNPPYIEAHDPHLDRGDLRFEPRAALSAGADGLRDLRRIATEAAYCLRRGGHLLVEHGAAQGPVVRALLSRRGYQEIRTLRDLAGLERLSMACRPDRAAL